MLHNYLPQNMKQILTYSIWVTNAWPLAWLKALARRILIECERRNLSSMKEHNGLVCGHLFTICISICEYSGLDYSLEVGSHLMYSLLYSGRCKDLSRLFHIKSFINKDLFIYYVKKIRQVFTQPLTRKHQKIKNHHPTFLKKRQKIENHHQPTLTSVNKY